LWRKGEKTIHVCLNCWKLNSQLVKNCLLLKIVYCPNHWVIYCKYTTQAIFFLLILQMLKSWKIKFKICLISFVKINKCLAKKCQLLVVGMIYLANSQVKRNGGCFSKIYVISKLFIYFLNTIIMEFLFKKFAKNLYPISLQLNLNSTWIQLNLNSINYILYSWIKFQFKLHAKVIQYFHLNETLIFTK